MSKETTAVIGEIRKERLEQITKHGCTYEHDDQHTDGSMAMTAACLAAPEPIFERRVTMHGHHFEDPYPHEDGGTPGVKEPGERRHQLIIAAALLVAEIERLDRE